VSNDLPNDAPSDAPNDAPDDAPNDAPSDLSKEAPKFAGPLGQLNPCGGGDPIPLIKKRMLVGRRGEADIQLKFNNVSTQHCRLTLEHGYWFVRDLNSRNGVKVDNRSVVRKRLDPGCKLSIARHEYIVEFDPHSLGAYGPPPGDDDFGDELMRSSLMDRAGLDKRDKANPASRKPTLD
jgi:adenylate cyclase